jgi:hypothetical protein
MYKISTWNIERPSPNTRKTGLAIKKILEENSDIIILTETSNAVDLSSVYPYLISTKSYERTPTEQWVTIWSKWQIIEQLKTVDDKRTVCGIIQTPFGKVILYGTIIPYHMAGVSGIRYGNLNYKTWEYHEKDLYNQSKNWSELKNDNQELPARYNGIGYGTKKVREILTQILQELEMTCITEIDFSKNYLTTDPIKGKTRNNIDHICVSNSLIDKFKDYNVGAWNHFTENGQYMSDHNGIFFEFDTQ